MIVGGNKENVIENIKDAVENDELNSKVEVNDPKLTNEQKQRVIKKYLKSKKKIYYRLNNKIARGIIKMVTWMENRDTEVIGLENVKNINTGAIITSNHFNPLDNTVVRKFAKKAGKKRIYVIGQESNLAMDGLIGFMMKYSDIIPISNQVSYMKNDFQKLIKETLDKKNFILIYPEQEMWFNYRKPRNLKPGAYYYASKYNVPIISCFIEIIDKDENDNDEFKKVKYKIHILKPIYPDSDKSDKENAAWMSQRDYSQKIEAYEKAYNKKLDYKFEDEDIAGWIDGE